MPERDDFGVRNRPHVSIDKLRSNETYRYKPQRQQRKALRIDYAAHAADLLRQLDGALPPVALPGTLLRLAGLKPGCIVEMVTLAPQTGSRVKATKMPGGVEFREQGIVILRSERRDDRTESALVFVPDDARAHLRDCVESYGRDPGQTPRFEAVETMQHAPAEALFVGVVDLDSPAPSWWELWVRGSLDFAASLASAAREDNLDIHSDRLSFPDTTVLFVHASAAQVARFANRVPGNIAEIRRAIGSIEPFLEQSGTSVGQHDWVASLAERVLAPAAEAPAVCTLDTGVSAGHVLIAPGLRGAWAYDKAWGTHDHARGGGHGTGMAGLVLYGDLDALMNSDEIVQLTHAVESMKLLPPKGFPPTEPPAYGVVTQGSVSLVEAESPERSRSFCLASSATDFPPGRPSTWSGALDQIAAGSMVGDMADGVPASERPKRLVLVATGNAEGGMKDDLMDCQDLEDPAQSWNSLTIGGFTRKETSPAPPFKGKPLVPANHRSPYSRGSCGLPDDLTPIKPEVLFEAGNMTVDESGYCSPHDAVSLLALGSDHVGRPLVPFWATSAASGVAGNFMGKLHAAQPALWPETLRALTIDSARWPQPMLKRLVGRGAHWKTTATKSEKQAILREVGYGVPDVERAIMSARNDVTLVAQAKIQPFKLAADGRSATFKEMDFYKLPWPRAKLQEMDQAIVTMRVTLSYFIEPNLTGRAGTRPDTYRSFGLRFAMRKREETEADFRARINDTQELDVRESVQESSYWLLGPKAVQAGSLHCDVWRGRAVELAGHDMIAVYPVGGWWKSHLGQRRANDTARYALVISISAPGQTVDLHVEVSNLVDVGQIHV